MCQIGFAHKNDGIHPGHVITGGSRGTVRFSGCEISSYDSVVCMSGLRDVIHEGTTFNPQSSRSKDYEKLAHNGLGGGFVPYLLGIRDQSVRFLSYIIGGGNEGLQLLRTDFRYTSRDHCVPIFAGPVTYFDNYLVRHRVRLHRFRRMTA